MIDIEKCRITHYPAKVLGGPAEPVEQIDNNIHQLVDKMVDIMLENKGIGLAAPQAGAALRLFIVLLDTKQKAVKAYVNPTLTCTGQLETAEEGCLSVPGIYTKIKRFKKCTVIATGLDGKEFTEEAEGLYARVLQHEYDHINGITIADRMGTAGRIAHRGQLKKLRETAEKKAEQ